MTDHVDSIADRLGTEELKALQASAVDGVKYRALIQEHHALLEQVQRLTAELGRWHDLHGADDPGDAIRMDVAHKHARLLDERLNQIRQLTAEVERLRRDAERPVGRMFECPACGGNYFGRDTAKMADGTVGVLATVRCHDQHGKGCEWRGEW